jgi:hypothetical protein
MGAQAVAAFDTATRQALEELCAEGIAQRDGRLQLTVESWMTWGKPRSPAAGSLN